MKLSQKQISFVTCVAKGMTLADAYRASYSAEKMKPETIRKRASELMANGDVEGMLKELQSKAVTDAVMTRQEALERLSLIASTDVTDILEFQQAEVVTDEGTTPVTVWRMKDSKELKAKAAATIKSVTMTKNGPKIEFHDKLSAISQLSKMQGWDSPTKLDVSSSVDITLDEASKATLDALAGKLVD